jgi:hypothetical protein
LALLLTIQVTWRPILLQSGIAQPVGVKASGVLLTRLHGARDIVRNIVVRTIIIRNIVVGNIILLVYIQE